MAERLPISEIDKMLEVAREVQPDLWERTEGVAKIIDPGAFLENAIVYPPEAEEAVQVAAGPICGRRL